MRGRQWSCEGVHDRDSGVDGGGTAARGCVAVGEGKAQWRWGEEAWRGGRGRWHGGTSDGVAGRPGKSVDDVVGRWGQTWQGHLGHPDWPHVRSNRMSSQ